MGYLRNVFYVLLLLCLGTDAISQGIDISFPAERAIFQRNNGNATIVYIAGNYRRKIDRIEAKLIPLQGGTPIDWTPIVTKAFHGTYRGSLVVSGGWYELRVRGIFEGEVVAESHLKKFGVGEVFLISGQSNAQGYFGKGQNGASDDRVNVVSNFLSEGVDKPSYPAFGHLDAESSIAPNGHGAWYWGNLGDLLVQKLNVPILFMNAAWEGFQVGEFIKSGNGEAGTNPYSGYQAPPGYPFGSMSDALHYYTNMTGVRAILWHQGESDNHLGTSFEKYVGDLTNVINHTRTKTGKDLTWLVARVSKDQNRFYQPVIDAQNFVINNNGNVFEGPNTDLILDRTDGVHFSTSGFPKVAQAWANSMSPEFFNNSIPQYGNPPLYLDSYCSVESAEKPMILSAPLGYVNYKWNSGESDRSAQVGPGWHQSEAIDYYGNVYYSAPIKYDNTLLPIKPNISSEGATEFCSGESVVLNTNNNFWNYWSNGFAGQFLKAEEAGEYYVTHVNIYLCGAQSESISINELPVPKPEILASGPLEICSDETLILSSSLSEGIEWSTGSTAMNLAVSTSGVYSLTAKNEAGCIGTSDLIAVNVKPSPIIPEIFNLGGESFCENDSTILSVSNEQNLTWSTGIENSKELIIKTSGEYFAINSNPEGCQSISNKINITVNPIPEKPSILIEGNIEVCDDEVIVLKASPAYAYSWSTGHNSSEVEISNSRSVFLRIKNEFNCLSEPSDIKEIEFLERPKNPKIVQSGTFTLSSIFSSDTNNLIYEWRLNDEIIENHNANLKALKSGDYYLKGSKNYELNSGEQKTCFSEESLPFKYFLNAEGEKFSYYPNPVPNKEITIETLDNLENATVTIYSLNGKLLFTEFVELFNEPKKFDLSNIPYGKYILKIRNKKSKFAGKIMID